MGIQERKEREKEMRRQAIMDAAQHLFFEQGPENTTMDQIAHEAEFAKGTLYLYFSSKEHIQYEISMRGTNLLNKKMEDAVNKDESGLQNLINVGWAFIRFAREEAEYFNLFMFFQKIDMNELSIPKENISEYFKKASPLTIILDLVKTGIEDGSIRNDLSVVNTATTLWSSVLGLLIVQQNKKEIYEFLQVDENEVLAANFDILTNGLRPKQ